MCLMVARNEFMAIVKQRVACKGQDGCRTINHVKLPRIKWRRFLLIFKDTFSFSKSKAYSDK